MFCDLVGSTELAERLDPEVLRIVMDEYLGLARAAIERHGGIVGSFTGDGAVGLFGLTVADESDTVHAAQAGLELLAALSDAREAATHGVVLRARVGVETGEVLGDVALAASGALAGDVLNTAARLQAAATPGTVVAGPAATHLLRGHADLRPMAPLTLKGKSAAVACTVVASAAAGPRHLSASPYVGRRGYLAMVTQALESVITDRLPICATVVGDAGIGKSRLLDSFVSQLSGETVLRTHVRPPGETTSLGPISDLVTAAVGGGTAQATAERIDELAAGRPDAAALGAALQSLAGYGTAGAVEHGWAFRRLLEMLSARQPVVVVIDDLHWGGAALIDLVKDAARWTPGPVLFLCAARTDLLEDRSSWPDDVPRAVTIPIDPLSVDESRTLADALLGERSVDAEAIALAAEGNPLFVEQLVAERERVGSNDWDPRGIPVSIRALIEARLDRCRPEVSRALSIAAVQGSLFNVDVVDTLWKEAVDLRSALRDAERGHLARLLEPNVGTFAHALIRETAYQRLPKKIRADLHCQLTELLPSDDETVGTHLERAAGYRAELGRRDFGTEHRAGERLARAGATAFARLDLVTSSQLLARAERLLPTGSATRLGLLPDLAVALMENGYADEAHALLRGAVAEAVAAGSRRDAMRIRLQELALFVFTEASDTEVRAGIGEGRALLDELAALGDDVGLAQGWIVLEYLHWLVGEVANVEQAAGRSVTHAERAGRLREQVQAGGDQSIGLILGPLPVTRIRELAEIRCASPNPVVAAGGAAGLAAAAALSDDIAGYEAAESRWRYAVESGGLEWAGGQQAVMGLAAIQLEAGNPERAEMLARDGLETMQRLGDVWVLNGSSFILALALGRQGRTAEAVALALAQNERYVWMGITDAILRSMALSMVCAAEKSHSEALVHAREAARAAQATDSNLYRSLTLEHLAHTLGPNTATAIAALHEVADIDHRWGNIVGSKRVATTLAQWTNHAVGP